VVKDNAGVWQAADGSGLKIEQVLGGPNNWSTRAES
jgi:hypothetical protein